MGEDYVAKKDLAEFGEQLTNVITGKVVEVMNEFQRNTISHMEENFATKHELAAMEERINEKIHNTETRLLRSFEHHAQAVESQLATLDVHTAANFLEARMLDLEMGRRPPQ